MIEEGFISGKISDSIITNYLSSKKLSNIKHLVLACTHYPLIQKEICRYYKNKVNVIDPTFIVAKHIKNKLTKSDILNNSGKGKYLFYASNYTKSFEKSARFFFKQKIIFKELNLWR